MAKKSRLRELQGVMADAGRSWNDNNAPRLGAALSYYTVFSIAPVLVLVIAVASLFLGRKAAQGAIVDQLTGLVGRPAAVLLQDTIASAGIHGSIGLATIIGVVTLLVGATGVMVELQAALDTIWKVTPRQSSGVKGIVKDRLLSLGLVLTFGFILLVSLVFSAGLTALGGWLSGFIPGWVLMGYILNYGVSVAVIAALFALLFKFLPNARVAWRDVWVGAGVTSAFFHVGKLLISLYLGKASVTSAFGAAGSLAGLLIWIYYSSQIALFGAAFTKAYAERLGSRIVPADAQPDAGSEVVAEPAKRDPKLALPTGSQRGFRA